MIPDIDQAGAAAIASAVRSRVITATEVTGEALDRIRAADPILNCFTAVLEDRAFREAREIDRRIAAGEDPGPLAGVPYAVKNLFDVRGIATLAGSVIRAGAPPAEDDAFCISALRRSGAVLLGALNMDEFAYGFTTENSHYGATHNPHDLTRVAGGSSGGSAAAVAGGVVPLALGSDTNGSIRVPAAFCGIFGIKPTYGRLSRRGAFPFAGSLDHVGPFARSVEDLALAYDAMQGFDPGDSVCADRPAEPASDQLHQGAAGLRIAVAGGYFMQWGGPGVLEAVAAVAQSLGTDRVIEIPEAARARAAAYLITASEGGCVHLNDLRTRAEEFDPLVRGRLQAGALLPASWIHHAQRFRAWYREQLREVFREVDVIIAPATPCEAIRIGQETIRLGQEEVPSRANIGVYTQPVSFAGLPVVMVPVHRGGKMPLGVQLIGAPWSETKLLRVAWELQRARTCTAPVARSFADPVAAVSS